jgi:hypothetical protein
MAVLTLPVRRPADPGLSLHSSLPTGSTRDDCFSAAGSDPGASLYFPPLFKAVLLGLLGWLPVHHLLRDWLYGGDVWHPC